MSQATHIRDLVPDPQNARKHSPRNVGTIADALREVGAARSIVVDEDGVILAGNATVEAAAEAGITKVQVVEADGQTIIAVRRSGLTPTQKARLALFDNRAAELADGWDTDVLKALQSDGVDLSNLWHDDELAELLGNESQAGLTEAEARATLAERFGVPPFSVLDARQGYWQTRKRAWLALGIESEIGRGGMGVTNERTEVDMGSGAETAEGTRRHVAAYSRGRANATPGGSLMPAADYSRRQRGDGRGRPVE